MAESIDRAALLRKVAIRFGAGVLVVFALLFLPAGSLAFWEAWVYLGVLLALMLSILSYLLARNPALLEKRLQMREREPAQKRVIAASLPVFATLYLIPGLDWRFGWSRMPAWLVVAGLILFVAGYLGFVAVLRANAYLSRVVEVQEGQKVIDSGPYAIVRHPMYASALAIYFGSSLALGSYWALIPAAAIVPFLVVRILDEERLLRRELPGYEEYCAKRKWRLIPGIW